MREIKIIALNDTGERAIRKALEDDSKESLVTKVMANRLKIKRVIISTKPFTVAIILMDLRLRQLLTEKDFTQMTLNRLVENGCKESDVSLEVL